MSDSNTSKPLGKARDIKVDPPIEKKGVTYDVLQLREPRSGEALAAEEHYKGGLNMYTVRLHNITLVARVSGWPEEAVKALPVTVLEEASSYLGDFLARSGTG